MQTVADILKSKDDQTVDTVSPMTSVLDAVKLMAEKDIVALVVVEEEKFIGIVTERDYARKIVLRGRDFRENAGARHHDLLHLCSSRPDQRGLQGADGEKPSAAPAGDDQPIGMISIRDFATDVIANL